MTAARNRRNSRKAGGRRRAGGLPHWGLLLSGILLGVVAMAAVMFIREQLTSEKQTETPSEPAPAAKPRTTPRPKTSGAPPEKRFEFYDVLPDAEVVIPQEGAETRTDKTPAPITVPGVYVLQAGSFGSFAEADRMKAQLALLGIRSQIQEITVDEREYHRVRIGPIEDLAELNRTRQRLRNAKIDALLIRVGE